MQRSTILVLDDDAFVLRFVERVLSTRYAILTASSFDEARLLLAAEDVSVILCDLKLGTHDGGEFLREISRTHPQIRRVLMSAASPEVLNDHQRQGVVHAIINKGESTNEALLAAVEITP